MDMATPVGVPQQPHPFFMIFSVELRERSSYCSVQGVLAALFIKQLGFSQEQASITFGALAALVCGLTSIGGYVGDHLLGTRCIIALGTLVLAIGYFITDMSLLKPDLTFTVLGAIAVGSGLFKTNPASLLSKCYPLKNPRLSGALTLFYTSINIGSLIALSLAPMIANRFGYSVTYNLCGAGLTIALLAYIVYRGMVKGIGSEPDFQPMSFSELLYILFDSMVMALVYTWLIHNVEVANLVPIILSIVVTIIFFCQTFKLDKIRHNKMLVAFVLMLEAVVLYILYAQIPMPLNLFTINNVHHEILDLSTNSVSLQASSPFWVILANPMLAGVYTHLDNEGKDLSMPMKLIFGMSMCLLSLLTAIAAGMWFANAQGLISSRFIMLAYLFQSLGGLFISALDLVMIAALVPQYLMGFTFGMRFLTQTATFLLGGYVAISTVILDNITNPPETSPVYTNAFGRIGLVALGVAVVVLLVMPWLERMITTPESH